MLWTVAALCAAMLLGVLLVVPETHPADVRRASGATVRDGVRTVLRTPRVPGSARGVRTELRRDDGLHLVLAVRLPERRRAPRDRLRDRLRRERRRPDRPRLGGQPPRRPLAAADHGAYRRRCPAPRHAGVPGLALADAPAWLLPIPIFVAVASNGAIMGNSAALAMAEVRPVAGTGSAVLGFAQFGLGAVVAPLVGLGGEASAVVPALVMTVSSSSASVSRTVCAAGSSSPSSGRRERRPRRRRRRRTAAAAARRRPARCRGEGASGRPR